MTEIQLNPVTRDKLTAFGKRRKRLILLRGICTTAGSLLAVMTLVAFFDRFIILSDMTRLVMSILAYLSVVAPPTGYAGAGQNVRKQISRASRGAPVGGGTGG